MRYLHIEMNTYGTESERERERERERECERERVSKR